MSTPARASYTDTFSHAFDEKGRITVPSEWRQPGFEEYLFVLPSSESCLKVYPTSWLGRLQEEVSSLKASDPKRLAVQLLASKAQSASFDQQGRIMVKKVLRENAGIIGNKGAAAVLVGCLDHFQIWDKAAWTAKDTATMTVEEALEAIGL